MAAARPDATPPVPPPKRGRLRPDPVDESDVASAGRHVPKQPSGASAPPRGIPLLSRWWFTPLAGLVLFIYLFRSDGGQALLPGGGSSTWFPQQPGAGSASAFPPTVAIMPGARPGGTSARVLARSAWWIDGSDAVLTTLSACLLRVPSALSSAGGSAGAVDPAASGAAPAPAAGAAARGASVPAPLADSAGLGRAALEGYYRDVCLQPLASPAWNDFVTAYGQRPRAWILQYFAAAEDQFDRHVADGLPPADAWEAAFGGSAAVVERLRAELRAVYGRTAAALPAPSGSDAAPGDRQ